MNRIWIASAALLCLASVPAQGQNAKKAPGWLGSYDQAKAQARQSGKPIFLVFR